MNTLQCRLTYYAYLYSGKLLWGLDCELEQIEIELYKLHSYIKIKEVQSESNDCTKIIPISLEQKVNNYIKLMNKKSYSSKICRNC